MDEPSYLNFDLQIEPWQGAYRAQVVESPVDRGCCSQFALAALEPLLKEGVDLDQIKAFGTRLFNAVFTSEVYSYLRRSQDEAERQGAEGLRVRLLLTDVPELADLPWEYLYDPAQDQFLSLSTKTPIIRYLDVSQRAPSLAVKPPLHILVMISSPKDQPPLDVDQEWAKLGQALADLQAKGRVILERLAQATLPALQTRLRQGEFHVFHYVGHGGFDEQAQDGILILENEEGLSQPVNGQALGTLLQDESTLRLALLNACEGAHSSRSDPFSGTAQSLVRRRIPAVIAMQTAISDEAAKTFAYEFYRALADDYPVDAALTEARKAIYLQGNQSEWGTPVLFMRSSDGRLEEEQEPAGTADQPGAGQPAVLPRPRSGLLRKRVHLGPLAVPLAGLLALPLAAVAVVVLLAGGLIGPARMAGRFNVAIAGVGVLDANGRMHSSQDSQLVTRWMVESVQQANKISQHGNVTLWYDGLPLSAKRTRLGMVAGQTAQDRAEAADKLAAKIDAHVIIYAYIDPATDPPQVVLEFYVAPRVRVESTATIGRYQLGDPIPIPADFNQADPLASEALARRIQNRTGLLFWLLLGLREDLLGTPSNELAILRQAEQELSTLREQGEGKELLYYFAGRAALFLNFYDEAQASLQQALNSNPAYARAQIALGSVYLDRAQTLETPQQRLAPPHNLDQAIASYQKGIDLARQANEPLTEIVGRLALAHAYRLEGETYSVLDNSDQANALFDQAIQDLRLVVGPLDSAQQYRLLAQAYSALGAAYAQQGQLLQIGGDLAGSRAQYASSVQAYASCIAQGARAPEDDILQTQIIDDPQNGCKHWQTVIQNILTQLP
jgi:tetratricopeptide (TPR) repeat protein